MVVSSPKGTPRTGVDFGGNLNSLFFTQVPIILWYYARQILDLFCHKIICVRFWVCVWAGNCILEVVTENVLYQNLLWKPPFLVFLQFQIQFCVEFFPALPQPIRIPGFRGYYPSLLILFLKRCPQLITNCSQLPPRLSLWPLPASPPPITYSPPSCCAVRRPLASRHLPPPLSLCRLPTVRLSLSPLPPPLLSCSPSPAHHAATSLSPCPLRKQVRHGPRCQGTIVHATVVVVIVRASKQGTNDNAKALLSTKLLSSCKGERDC